MYLEALKNVKQASDVTLMRAVYDCETHRVRRAEIAPPPTPLLRFIIQKRIVIKNNYSFSISHSTLTIVT